MRDACESDQLVLLGHFSLTLDQGALTQFSYDKVKALLVYLLLHRQPVSRAALAELLWPDQGVSSGRTNLRHALHCLRHALGERADDVLSVSRQTIGVTLPQGWQMDVHRLESLLDGPQDLVNLDAVLACYRGELVEELQLVNCAAFQRWLVQVRNEWRQRVVRFAEQVLDAAEKVSDGVLEQLVSRFSGYGPFHQRLVKQLAEQGQMAAAHERYNAYLQLLPLSGQQPEPEFLQLASYWSDGEADPRAMTPKGAYSRALAAGSAPLREDEIELRQLSVMAIRLTLEGEWQDRGAVQRCLTLQLELLRWLEQQCHHLGGFWLPGATGGLGLACFGTHGPAHQLAELVALYEHCRHALPQEAERHWGGAGEPPHFTLAAGLHSGRAVYLPERQLADPLGQVTQMSLELMSAAEGSELVISQEASQHMPPALDLQPRLASRLVASDGRVRLRALALGQNEGGRDATPPSLVGRETALRKLCDALARAGIGLRQSVMVSGASGMGKSALMVSFRQLELSRGVAICWQPTTRLSVLEPYGIARNLIAWYCEARPDATHLRTLQRRLAMPVLDTARQQRLEEALGAREVQDAARLTQSGEATELVVALVHRLVEHIANEHTLVLMIDDLQWVDEPSFKVLAGLQARLPINTAFMLVASHHGRESLPIRLHWDQQVSLGPLDALQSSRLLSLLSRRYRLHLSPRLRHQVVERCDGVPLYLQEICRRLDIDRREGRTVQLDALPNGIFGLLASRIDQLGGDRDVAHVAAMLGRRFRLDFLAACSELEPAALSRAVEQMHRLEIIEPAGDRQSTVKEYQFSHRLLQEAAYLSCPRDVRTRLHQQVVTLIEERFPVWISRHPGDFAVHLSRSGHDARSARYFELAAREALKVSANRTALRMADSGLESLERVGHEPERSISLLTVRGQAAFALEGHGSHTALESFERARTLLREAQEGSADPVDPAAVFLVKWGLWVAHSQRYDHAEAFALTVILAELAAKLEDPCYRRLADYARAHCEYWSGHVEKAHRQLEALDPLNTPMMIEWLPFSDHPQVTAACIHGWALCLRGDYSRAERQIAGAIRLAEQINHPGTLAMAFLVGAALYRQLGHVHMARRHAEKAAAISNTPDMALWQLSAQGVLGWQKSLGGDARGLGELEQCLEEMAELTGFERYLRPVLWYTDACLALDKLDTVEGYLDQCLDIALERNTLFLPELALQLAYVRERKGRAPDAIKALASLAITQARKQGNRHQELAALELWLTRIAPDDGAALAEFRRLLGDVQHSDAPVWLRWMSLGDRRLAALQPES
ncbi:AAA family ATPase [Vreelandella subglaciescola]|uniref:AAA ATPase domain-containing protein n=1 Tax=Vreelandella subglaciescola TaxID=29571 RepID=A0A1M7EVN2_9GAMM|nr:AAA family ATPase [Halomonas subglaciescola]SHL95569.1 AAA ATPase domain-containing protein [Halomonas subglaciescola]